MLAFQLQYFLYQLVVVCPVRQVSWIGGSCDSFELRIRREKDDVRHVYSTIYTRARGKAMYVFLPPGRWPSDEVWRVAGERGWTTRPARLTCIRKRLGSFGMGSRGPRLVDGASGSKRMPNPS